jgi:hypothetical protein
MPRTIISKIKKNPYFMRDSAASNNKVAKKKKVKFKKISFKISDVQKDALEAICKRQKTTPVRFLKSVIKKQTARYKPSSAPISYVTENQLQLFDLEVPVVASAKMRTNKKV